MKSIWSMEQKDTAHTSVCSPQILILMLKCLFPFLFEPVLPQLPLTQTFPFVLDTPQDPFGAWGTPHTLEVSDPAAHADPPAFTLPAGLLLPQHCPREATPAWEASASPTEGNFALN